MQNHRRHIIRKLRLIVIPIITLSISILVFVYELDQHKYNISPHNKLQLVADWPRLILLASLAIGFLTMTIIEFIKITLVPKFHKLMVQEWLKNKDAIDELIFLALSGNKKAFYNLSIENICGQIAVASQSALENPTEYKSLLMALLSVSIEKKDVWKNYQVLLAENIEINSTLTIEEARSDIAPYIQRRIDALQVDAKYQWKRKMILFSLSVSMLISTLGNIYFVSKGSIIVVVLQSIFFSIIASYFAHVFKDMISIIEKYRK